MQLDQVCFDEDYLLRHRRGRKLQEILPQSAVLAKERLFAWAQSLFITRMCEYLPVDCAYDVGLLKPGLSYLGNELRENGISTLTFENQPDLLSSLEARVGPSGDRVLLDSMYDLAMPDNSVGICVSHNLLQKMETIEQAEAVIMESIRVSGHYACHQVTDKNNVHYSWDDMHALALSIGEWEAVFNKVIAEVEDDWRLMDIHIPKAFNIVGAQRPPVFVMERGEHKEKRALKLRHTTRIGRIVQDNSTLANLISLSKPLIVYYGLQHCLNEPAVFSALSGSAFALDAVDGIAARHYKSAFRGTGLGAYVDLFSDRAVELMALWTFGLENLIPLAIPGIFTTKDVIVDSTRIYRSIRHGNLHPLIYGRNDDPVERTAYAAIKGIYISSVPVCKTMGPVGETASQILGCATTAFALYRGGNSLLDIRRQNTEK